MNINTLIVGLIVYGIVTTCYLFGVCVSENKDPFANCLGNGLLSLVIWGVVMGVINVYMFYQ